MEYRKLPHGSERISVIGLGTSVVGEHSVQNVVETVTFALDSGVNYIDLAGGHALFSPASAKPLPDGGRTRMYSCISARTIPPANTAGTRRWTASKNPSHGSWSS